MRIKRLAALGVATGALVLSGGLAVAAADSTGGTAPSSTTAPGDDRPDRGERARHMIVNGERLSDEQRECMEENAPPPPFESGERPTREEMGEHREEIEAAMDECGIDHPEPREDEEGGFAFRMERGGPGEACGGEFGVTESRIGQGTADTYAGSAVAEAAPANA